jgi:protein involved in polysaccharide export with SLBB domain
MKKYFAILLALCATLLPALGQEAVIRSGDTFDLRIGGVPPTESTAINGSYTVDGGGYLNLPFLGKMAVSNMTASQIQSSAERGYVDKGIYTHPTITITVASTARFVNVGGQVKSPGRMPYTPDMTVMSAINAAGDFNDYADQTKVRLTRGSKVTIVNCKAIRKDPSQDLKVTPGDQIQVPQGFF